MQVFWQHGFPVIMQLIVRLELKEKRNPLLKKWVEKGSSFAYIKRFMQQCGVITGKIHGHLRGNGNRSAEQHKTVFRKKKFAFAFFFLDVRENCVGRSSGRVCAPISGKLLIGFIKYFHSELRSWGR